MTLWALVLSQLALPDSCALLGRLKSQQRPIEMGIEKKKNLSSDSHSTEKGYLKECAGMFHIMSQEDPACTLMMKLSFKCSFAVLIFTAVSVSLQ